jgi:hypothetical protein
MATSRRLAETGAAIERLGLEPGETSAKIEQAERLLATMRASVPADAGWLESSHDPFGCDPTRSDVDPQAGGDSARPKDWDGLGHRACADDPDSLPSVAPRRRRFNDLVAGLTTARPPNKFIWAWCRLAGGRRVVKPDLAGREAGFLKPRAQVRFSSGPSLLCDSAVHHSQRRGRCLRSEPLGQAADQALRRGGRLGEPRTEPANPRCQPAAVRGLPSLRRADRGHRPHARLQTRTSE